MGIDPDFAADLARELPPEDYVRVLEMFRQDMNRLAGEMAAAARANDVDTFRRAAHGLAGAAGAVGAASLEAACRLAMSRREVIVDLAATAADIDRLSDATLADIDAALERAKAR